MQLQRDYIRAVWRHKILHNCHKYLLQEANILHIILDPEEDRKNQRGITGNLREKKKIIVARND